MNMQELKNIAKNHGLRTTKMSKADIIKQIQVSEGNFDCFATPVTGECDQQGCLWREDCLSLAAQPSIS
ncbi:MAG: SAP domain-containing protein [Gammaproteobacteria bacterium]|nr:SAP domain-containing protein [Gammaproteobacteria bacterium]